MRTTRSASAGASTHFHAESQMDESRSRRLTRVAAMIVALLLSLAAGGTAWAQGGALRVGTAKVNITPRDVEPVTIRDSLYVRAIVIDNGTTRAALLNV